jgi:hypothetical protein
MKHKDYALIVQTVRSAIDAKLACATMMQATNVERLDFMCEAGNLTSALIDLTILYSHQPQGE